MQDAAIKATPIIPGALFSGALVAATGEVAFWRSAARTLRPNLVLREAPAAWKASFSASTAFRWADSERQRNADDPPAVAVYFQDFRIGSPAYDTLRAESDLVAHADTATSATVKKVRDHPFVPGSRLVIEGNHIFLTTPKE